ncbi:uroporphyrinogen III synthase [Salmonella enterica subsp. enterica]|nr:uroporphyrinogen III synthase [Salmonella enterica subsp. enterica]
MSILITRPSPAGEALVSRLRALGQVAWSFPLIEFVAGRELPTLADRLATLTEKRSGFCPFTARCRLCSRPAPAGWSKLACGAALFRDWPHHGARPSYR